MNQPDTDRFPAITPNQDPEYLHHSLFTLTQEVVNLRASVSRQQFPTWLTALALVLVALCECHIIYNESRGLRVLVRDKGGDVRLAHEEANLEERRKTLVKFIRYALEVDPHTIRGDRAQAKRMCAPDLRAKKEMEWSDGYFSQVQQDKKLGLFDFENAIFDPVPNQKLALWNVSSNYTLMNPDGTTTKDKVAFTFRLIDAPRDEGNFWWGLQVVDYQPIPLTKQN